LIERDDNQKLIIQHGKPLICYENGTWYQLWAYMMFSFQDLSVYLPYIGDVAFAENMRYFLVTGLFLAFTVFLIVRKEKEASESNQQFE